MSGEDAVNVQAGEIAPVSNMNEQEDGVVVVDAREGELPIYICAFCGPQKPGEGSSECTLCLQSFCVAHLAPRNHYCYGALGKAQA